MGQQVLRLRYRIHVGTDGKVIEILDAKTPSAHHHVQTPVVATETMKLTPAIRPAVAKRPAVKKKLQVVRKQPSVKAILAEIGKMTLSGKRDNSPSAAASPGAKASLWSLFAKAPIHRHRVIDN